MTPSKMREKVVAERVKWVKEMLKSIRSLPAETYEEFRSDPRTVAAAESYLRRGLEALLDLGRHLLAKGFGKGVPEYKQIAVQLERFDVLSPDDAKLMRVLAGYRNRLVHLYQEISDEEIYEICTGEIQDMEHILRSIAKWIKDHPEMIDREL